MKLVFADKEGKQRVLGYFDTKEDAEKCIASFLKDKNYESPYYRIIHFDNKLTYDVGSWSEFFVLYFNDNAEYVGVWDEA